MNTADWTRIDRVLAGEATAEEVAEVEAWAAHDPKNAALLDALRDGTSFAAPSSTTDAAWAKLRASVVDDDVQPASWTGVMRPTTKPSRRTWLRAAAIACVAIVASALWRTTRQPSPVERTVAATDAAESIRLEDGSTVTLAIGSSLTWVEPFAADARIVSMAGEAVFDVAADAARPFRIAAPPVSVIVVGTRFILRAWPEAERAEVLVSEGIVRVETPAGTTSINPDRGLIFDRGALTFLPDVNFATETSWMDGRLEFVDAPLASVLPRLARRFDLEFIIENPALEARRVSASFDAPTVDRVLAALALALDVRFEREGRVVTIQ